MMTPMWLHKPSASGNQALWIKLHDFAQWNHIRSGLPINQTHYEFILQKKGPTQSALLAPASLFPYKYSQFELELNM